MAAIFEIATKYQTVSSGSDYLDARIRESRRVLELQDMASDEVLQNLEMYVRTLKVMLQVCVHEIDIFEHGDKIAMMAFMEQCKQDNVRLQQCLVDDVEVQEELSELWERLPDNEERLFRMRFLVMLNDNNEVAQGAIQRADQMQGITQGLQTIDLEENKQEVMTNEQAALMAKTDLAALMEELTMESNKAAKKAQMNAVANRAIAAFSGWMQQAR